MFRSLYNWTLRLAAHRHAIRYMGAISFAESSFFPIPPDVMVVPMVIARRDQAYWIATVVTVCSVMGACLGYAIGYFLWDQFGGWMAQYIGLTPSVREAFLHYGVAIILLKGFTPIPFKLVTIASGLFHFNFPLFVLLALITRGARFFLICWALKRWGEPVQAFIEKRLALVFWGVLGILVGGFALIYFL